MSKELESSSKQHFFDIQEDDGDTTITIGNIVCKTTCGIKVTTHGHYTSIESDLEDGKLVLHVAPHKIHLEIDSLQRKDTCVSQLQVQHDLTVKKSISLLDKPKSYYNSQTKELTLVFTNTSSKLEMETTIVPIEIITQ